MRKFRIVKEEYSYGSVDYRVESKTILPFAWLLDWTIRWQSEGIYHKSEEDARDYIDYLQKIYAKPKRTIV